MSKTDNSAAKNFYLDEVSTKLLVNELITRKGVEVRIAEPYEDLELKVNGPAIVIQVID